MMSERRKDPETEKRGRGKEREERESVCEGESARGREIIKCHSLFCKRAL